MHNWTCLSIYVQGVASGLLAPDSLLQPLPCPALLLLCSCSAGCWSAAAICWWPCKQMAVLLLLFLLFMNSKTMSSILNAQDTLLQLLPCCLLVSCNLLEHALC